MINAFGLFMYVVAVGVWYGYFFAYTTTYYNINKSVDEKLQSRTRAMKAWMGDNFASFLA